MGEYVDDDGRFYVMSRSQQAEAYEKKQKTESPAKLAEIAGRLEELRRELIGESISQSELLELEALAAYIEPGDVELLEPANVCEFG
jgi:hypothetical protein